MTPHRLTIETAILDRYFPNKFRFENLNLENEYLDVGVKVQSGKVYRLKILLAKDYPNVMPRVYITYPLPLYKKDGSKITGPSHDMHTLTSDNENIQICNYKSEKWDVNVTLYKVILKARIWLEAYEGHVRTGKPIDDFLNS